MPLVCWMERKEGKERGETLLVESETTLDNFEGYGMNIRGFVWLDGIVEKLQWKHDVFQGEGFQLKIDY